MTSMFIHNELIKPVDTVLAWTYLIGGSVAAGINAIGFVLGLMYRRSFTDKVNGALKFGLIYLGYDVLMGTSYALAGASWLYIYKLKRVSPWICFTRPYTVLFILNDTAAGVLPLLTAFQIYHIVARPLSEVQSFTKASIIIPVSLALGIIVPPLLFHDETISQSSICMLINSIPLRFYFLLKFIILFFNFLTLFVYTSFMISYCRHYAHITEKAANWYRPVITVIKMILFLSIFTLYPTFTLMDVYSSTDTQLTVAHILYFSRCYVNMYIFAVTKNKVYNHILGNIPLIGYRFRPPEWRCKYNIETNSTGEVVRVDVRMERPVTTEPNRTTVVRNSA